MNDHPIIFDPEDARLTAYALGELHNPAERAAVEQILQASPEARETLREIREITAALGAEYEQERTLAAENTGTDPLPDNVITLRPTPMARFAWPRPLLPMAAMLLLIALVAGLMVQRLAVGPSAVFSVTQSLSKATRPAQVAQAQIALPQSAAGQTAALPATASRALRQDEVILAQLPPPPAVFAGTVVSPAAAPVDALVDFGKTTSAAGTTVGQAGELSLAPMPLAAATPRPAFDASMSSARADAPAAAAPASPPMFAQAKDEVTASGSFALRAPGSDGSDLQRARGITVDQTRANAFGSADRVMAMKSGSMSAAVGGAISQAKPSGQVKSFQKQLTFGEGTADIGALAPAETASGSLGFADTDKRETLRAAPIAPGLERPVERPGTAVYEHRAENPFLAAKDNPLSTFSIDVDTASYANVRRFIEAGRLPPPDAVRIEELVNYFPYGYAPPAPGDEHPFAVHLEAAACPWNPQDRLVRIGIKGREMARDKRPPSNLVFLLDVSGSMTPPERLPLIKAGMRLLVEQLREDDRVAIVTYAGYSGVALPSTTGDQKERILSVLDSLHPGGSTNGASGIKLAYEVARTGFIKGGTNRVILATDGDFNVGVTSQNELVRMIESEARTGVALSALGVGTDNYKDATMQKLADKGNGNYAYIDKLDEARKVLVEQMSGTLVTIAKDVKIQVEFNPAMVAAYRLIGYEKRMLRKEDFNDDRVDAGEIGAGHSITALYEVVPAGQAVPQASPAVDALKYADTPGTPVAATAAKPATDEQGGIAPVPSSREWLTVKMRHKAPDGDTSERSYEESLTDQGRPGDFTGASPDFKFAAAVASFGLALRDSSNKGSATLESALALAQEGIGADPGGYRAGFVQLAQRAQTIQSGHDEIERAPEAPGTGFMR